jgi:DNA-binding NtrC family response regulator
MPKELILMVDNNVDFLLTREEYVTQAGYRVVKAYNAEDARSIAKKQHPSLAVVDVRLINDDDEGDRTGVFLAKSLREICPVIMLTNHATYEIVRQALKPDENDRSLAVDFMDKHEGPAELIQAVQRVLQNSNNTRQRLFGSKSFWRVFRIIAFTVLLIPMVISIILILRDNELGVTIGIIFSGLQVVVGIGGWIFENKRS